MAVTLPDESQAIEQLVHLCRESGQRLDLVQGGGGNASVKTREGHMLIKASGQAMCDVNAEQGITCVDHRQIRRDIQQLDPNGLDREERQQQANTILSEATLAKQSRPSIETYLHALLSTYTLHTHSVSAIAAASRPDWQEFLEELFPTFTLLVSYGTPGIDLALLLRQGLRELPLVGGSPQVIFLQNHGLIVSCTRFEEAMDLTYTVTDKLANALNMDLQPFQQVTQLSDLVKGCQHFPNPMHVYLSEDKRLDDLLQNADNLQAPIFCPDTVVYCGYKIVQMTDCSSTTAINDYVDQYHLPPRVFYINNSLYIVADSLKQARNIESVLKIHLLAYQTNGGKVSTLDRHELDYLSHWDAEKFRQQQ